MRSARLLVPLAIVAALVAGCSKDGGKGGSSAPTTPAVVLTDNGVAALPASEILTKALAALKGAKSVHIVGNVNSDGTNITVDLVLNDKKDGSGKLTMGGKTVELIRLGSDVYMKADAAFWKEFAGPKGDLVATLLAGKYLKATTNDTEFGGLAGFFDIGESLTPTGAIEKGETKVVNGVDAIAVIDKDQTNGGTFWVATKGEPYPLQLVAPDGSGKVDFLDYNKPVDIKAPPADQVVDIAKLKQLGG